MTTVDKRTQFQPRDGNVYKLRRDFDCTVEPLTAADVIQLFDIPKGTLVLGLGLKVITPEGDTATATFGDTDADGFDASADLNATALTETWNGFASVPTISSEGAISPAYGLGHFYSADDTITMTMGHTCDTAKFSVTVVCIPVFNS